MPRRSTRSSSGCARGSRTWRRPARAVGRGCRTTESGSTAGRKEPSRAGGPRCAAPGARCRFDWRAGPTQVVADRGRLAQALGNLLANAAEHGSGPLEVRGRRVPGAVRVEVRNGAGSAGRRA